MVIRLCQGKLLLRSRNLVHFSSLLKHYILVICLTIIIDQLEFWNKSNTIDIILFYRVFGLPADFKEGVVFSTYATLVSSVQKGERAVWMSSITDNRQGSCFCWSDLFFLTGANRQSRLQQLIDWCGGEQFNGCLIFDECHKAKHFVPVSDLQ